MDHPWRSVPYQTNICPVCSAHHFPFCPPPPPPFDPYQVRQPPPPPPPSWPYRSAAPPPPPPPTQHDFSDFREGPNKRMRVEDDGSRDRGPYMQGNPYNYGNYYNYGNVNYERSGIVQHGAYPRQIGENYSNGYRTQNSNGYSNHMLSVPNEAYYSHDPQRFNSAQNSIPANKSVFQNHQYGPQNYSITDRYTAHSYSSVDSVPIPHIPVANSVVPPSDFARKTNPTLFPVMPNNLIAMSAPNVAFNLPAPTQFRATEGLPSIYRPSSNQFVIMDSMHSKSSSLNQPINPKINIVNALNLFKPPHRTSRPDHFVIILRGLPGSGKSYLAKALRDIEIENGGSAPRIHAMDDYFMIEVEKEEEQSEGSKTSRSKRKLTKKVIEYCYEAEMEEAYRSSMLKAFKKTLDEGNFTFVIVDDRNLRVADFAQFWATAKRSGYEVYLLEAPYKDPAGCAARNVHDFKLEEIKKMKTQWEVAPPLYLQLDIQSLFHGDDLKGNTIQEVDMDMEDDDSAQQVQKNIPDNNNNINNENENNKKSEDENAKSPDYIPDTGLQKERKEEGREETEEQDEEPERVKDLGQSKWSANFEEDNEKNDTIKGNHNSLSGLVKSYSTSAKSVHWGDKAERGGFSIGASAKKWSLIIGPGSGYNLHSNPLVENTPRTNGSNTESKRRFTEQLRAESESFKAVFDTRRQRVGVLINSFEDD